MCVPAVLAVTSTVIVHASPIPNSPSLKVIVPVPAGAVTPAPPKAKSQVVEAFAGVATTTAPGTVGRVSVKARSVMGAPVPLVIVNVSVETEPGPMVPEVGKLGGGVGENSFVKPATGGGPFWTAGV